MTAPFQRAFREELLRVAERDLQRARRRRWSLRGAVAAVVAAVAAVGYGIAGQPAAADVEVRVEGGFVEVVLNSRDVTPAEVLDALADHSIDATVEGVPTGPSRVGLFTGAEVIGDPTAPRIEPLGGSAAGFAGFRLRTDWSGELVLGLGRPAGPGEPYDAFTSPFDEGEPLHCAEVLGRPLSAVADRLGDLDARVTVMEPAGVSHLSVEEAVGSGFGGWPVTGGQMVAADEVVLELAEGAGQVESC